MIELPHTGPDDECLARPPAVVRLGSGDQRAVVVTLSPSGLVRARADGLRAVSAHALRRTGLIGTDAADAIMRFTTEMNLDLPPQVDRLRALDALLGRPDPRDPPVVATSMHAAHELRRTLHVPHDLDWFSGHFPGEPILAGVVQLRWAVAAAGSLMNAADGPGSIRQLKFKSPIRPGSLLDLTLTRPDGASVVVFAYRSASGEHSSGRLHY